MAGSAAAQTVPNIGKVARNLGPQVHRAMIMRGDIGKHADGRDVIYTVVLGAPAILNVVDVKTGDLLTTRALEKASGAWGVTVAADNSVYLGAYNEGRLYRYLPDTGELKDLGFPFATKDSVLYPMASASDGTIYGGSYPSGHAYEYNPHTQSFRDLGDVTTNTEKERWIRATVLDEKNGKVYFGTGTNPQLVEYDLASGKKRELLTERFRKITAVYDLRLADGKLICRKESDNENENFVLDPASGQVLTVTNGDTGEKSDVFSNNSRETSPVSPVANKVYFARTTGLYELDMDTLTYKLVSSELRGALTGYGFVKLNLPEWPGYTLTGTLGNKALMYRYNLETGKTAIIEMALQREPVNLHELATGPDGKIYCTGYLAGNMGVFDPATGKTTLYEGTSQAEGVAFLGNNFYMGLYPGARINRYDITKPWNPTKDTSGNPAELFQLATNAAVPGFIPQDRPFGMATSAQTKKLFVGTVPKYGLLGGVLAIYDTSETTGPEIYPNVVKDQSIVSLLPLGSKLYGGTSTMGGMGITPTETEARLFCWNVAEKKLESALVPVKGAAAITDLITGPDGNIWGVATGSLFVFDPRKGEVVHARKHFDENADRVYGGSLVLLPNGRMFGTAQNRFFEVDTKTRDLKVIATGVSKVIAGADGKLYLHKVGHPELYQYTPEK